MRLPKLMILGHARHGKDTAGDYLVKTFGFRNCSSSAFALEKAVMPALALLGHTYANAACAMRDREQVPGWRKIWFDAISAYNTPDPARLARELYIDHDIYCGIRCIKEFEALKREGVIDYTIWIDASLRLPPEDSSSITIPQTVADFTVSNNTTLADLHHRLGALMRGVMTRSRYVGERSFTIVDAPERRDSGC